MPDQTSFEVQIYSPRWVHEERYEIRLDKEQMIVRRGTFSAMCSWIENRDPEWSGYNALTGNPLENILKNDSIDHPTSLVSALEHAWTEWRADSLDNQEVAREMRALFAWVNEVTQSRPVTDFWRMFF